MGIMFSFEVFGLVAEHITSLSNFFCCPCLPLPPPAKQNNYRNLSQDALELLREVKVCLKRLTFIFFLQSLFICSETVNQLFLSLQFMIMPLKCLYTLMLRGCKVKTALFSNRVSTQESGRNKATDPHCFCISL